MEIWNYFIRYKKVRSVSPRILMSPTRYLFSNHIALHLFRVSPHISYPVPAITRGSHCMQIINIKKFPTDDFNAYVSPPKALCNRPCVSVNGNECVHRCILPALSLVSRAAINIGAKNGKAIQNCQLSYLELK